MSPDTPLTDEVLDDLTSAVGRGFSSASWAGARSAMRALLQPLLDAAEAKGRLQAMETLMEAQSHAMLPSELGPSLFSVPVLPGHATAEKEPPAPSEGRLREALALARTIANNWACFMRNSKTELDAQAQAHQDINAMELDAALRLPAPAAAPVEPPEREQLRIALAALADIGHSTDLSREVLQRKARRIYGELQAAPDAPEEPR